jgi:Tfp pilus assembly protein PilV
MTCRDAESGWSLIEVVIATTLFTFLVMGLSRSILSTRSAAALSANGSVAATLAYDKLEDLRRMSASATDLTAGTHVDPLSPLRADGTAGGIFTRRWTVTDDVPAAGMKRVEMRVSWIDRTGSNFVSLVTLELP